MQRIFSFILIIMMTLSIFTQNIWAASDSVSVTIPTFQVTVDERAVDSTKLQYPLIVYNDITYFPLTWSWCRQLGLVSGYTNKDGLYIANDTAEDQDRLDNGGYQKAGSRYTAKIPNYPVYINGRPIDNSNEKYPLLNFRNVTYFPLTWRFVSDVFGWDQAWSNASGYQLCTYGSAAEPSPGTHYYEESFYTTKSYRNYAILENLKEERAISAEADESGGYSNSYIGRTSTYYKLDYSNDTLSKIASGETGEKPYHSGACDGEDVNDLFSANGSVLCFNSNTLIDLSGDAGGGNAIDSIIATKYHVNNMNVYFTSVQFTQNGKSIPAPYTPRKYYAWIDQGEGTLHQIKSWPVNQITSAVYPFGTDGVYLCSGGQIFGSSRYNNGCGWICTVDSGFSETTLNEKWADWNSLDAFGMDDTGNLYLLNTSFSDYDKLDAGQGTVSPIHDGFYRLGLDGTLTKIYPYVKADQIFVTPSGQIYIDAGWMNLILHLQSGARISPN